MDTNAANTFTDDEFRLAHPQLLSELRGKSLTYAQSLVFSGKFSSLEAAYGYIQRRAKYRRARQKEERLEYWCKHKAARDKSTFWKRDRPNLVNRARRADYCNKVFRLAGYVQRHYGLPCFLARTSAEKIKTAMQHDRDFHSALSAGMACAWCYGRKLAARAYARVAAHVLAVLLDRAEHDGQSYSQRGIRFSFSQNSLSHPPHAFVIILKRNDKIDKLPFDVSVGTGNGGQIVNNSTADRRRSIALVAKLPAKRRRKIKKAVELLQNLHKNHYSGACNVSWSIQHARNLAKIAIERRVALERLAALYSAALDIWHSHGKSFAGQIAPSGLSHDVMTALKKETPKSDTFAPPRAHKEKLVAFNLDLSAGTYNAMTDAPAPGDAWTRRRAWLEYLFQLKNKTQNEN